MSGRSPKRRNLQVRKKPSVNIGLLTVGRVGPIHVLLICFFLSMLMLTPLFTEISQGSSIFVGSSHDSPTVEYEYDNNGNMIGRKVLKSGGSLLKHTKYIVSDRNPTGHPQILYEKNGITGRLLKVNIWGPDGLLCQKEYVGPTQIIERLPHFDAQGTVRAVTHILPNGTQTTTQHRYTAWGEPINDPPAVGYAFHGQWRDPLTGLQFHQARWYDPKTGRWTSADPRWDFPENHGNAYTYAASAPTNNIDPTGENTILEKLSVLATQAQLAAIQNPYAVTLLGDIVVAFVVNDPYYQSPTPAGQISKATRLLGSEAIERLVKLDGWEVVAKQVRDNGTGIDVIFKKVGDEVYRIAEIKVSIGSQFRGLLGQARYGWQMSKQWIETTLDVIYRRDFTRNFSGMTSSLRQDQVEFIADNLGNPQKVEKVLYGMKILHNNKDTDMYLARLHELTVEFADEALGADAKPLLHGSSEQLMVFFENQ